MLMIMSKVDAVNIILSSIGSAPIDTLDDNNDVDVDNILRIMDRVSRSLQMKGWNFNTTTLVLKPDTVSKRILWNDSIIKHTSSDSNTYIKRGKYLFDMTNNTFEFTQDVTLSIVLALEFEDLPQAFMDYITAKAAVEFQTRYMGDNDVSQDLLGELQEAYQNIVDYDIHMGNYNMLNLTNVSEIVSRT